MDVLDAGEWESQRAQPAAVGRAGIRLAAVLMALLVLASIGGFLAHEHSQTLEQAAALSERRAGRLAGELGDALAVAAAAVQRTEARIAQVPAGEPVAALLAALAAEQQPLLAALPQPLRLLALGADGRPLAADAAAPGAPESLPAAAGWQVGLTRGAAGSRSVPLLRRATSGQHGVAAFLVELDHAALVTRLESSRTPEGGSAALFRIDADGSTVLLAGAPLAEAEIGQRVRGPLATAVARSPRGAFSAQTQTDQVQRTVAYQRLDGDLATLVVAYGMATDPVLADWRALLPWAAGAALLLLGGIGAGVRRLEAAQQAQADQLQALQRSAQRLREAQQLASIGSWTLDMRSGALTWSDEAFRIFERDPAHATPDQRQFLAMVHPEDRVAVDRAWQTAVAEHADYLITHRLLLPGGRIKHVQGRGRFRYAGDGTPLRALGTVQDVTARVQAEQAVRDGEARMRVLFEASPVPTLAYARGSLLLLAVNEAFTHLLGYSRDEALALSIPDLYPAEQRAVMVDLAAQVQGLNHVTDIQYLHKDGRRIDVETRSHDFAVDGRPGRISAIVDVTERRRAEAERRAAAERFQKLFEAAPEAISVSAVDGGRFLLVNDAFCQLIGYPREQVLGRTAVDLQLWIETPPREVVVQRLRAGEPVRDFEAVAQRGDGQAVDALFSAERIEFGGEDALLLMFRDISERKRLEAALRSSEQRFRVAASFGQVWEWDFGASGIAPSSEFFTHLGHGEVRGAQQVPLFERIVHPDDLRRLREALRRHLRRQGPYHLEFRASDAQGGVHWFETWGQALFDATSGHARYIAGTTFEITERKEAEEQVRRLAVELEQRVQERTAQLVQSEARYRTIFETAPISIGEEDWSAVQSLLRDLRNQGVDDGPGYFATRPDFVQACLRAVKLRRLNHKALALHDARSQHTDLPDLQAFYPNDKDLPQFVGELEALWSGQRMFTAKRSLPSVTGRPLNLMVSISLPGLDDDDGTALVCLVDITEIDRLNAELDLSVERLSKANRELETFTYSVSHDLKAPLRGIDGYSRLLLSDHGDRLDDEGRLFLQHIRQATQHMGALIDDLLAYSRLERRELALTTLPLAGVVASVVAGLNPALDAAGVQLEILVDPGLQVRGDAQGLSMALRNLLDNAVKFSRAATPPRITITASRSQGGIALAVRDNGIGFDMKFHDRIFSIFQRLHRAEDYPGTGIGLAIVRKAMERMGGHVWASSQPGEGATFTLQVPEA